MNYYEALERADDNGKGTGQFQFTQTNDGKTWPIGYCRIEKHTHNSKVEACDCYRKYCREQNNGMLPGGFPLESKDGTEMFFFGSY